MPTYDSPVDISLGQVPEEIGDQILYDELLSIHDAIEALVTYASGRTRFRGEWEEDTVYFHADQVLDGFWLMWAVEKNTERAAPIPIGVPRWALDETDPGWNVQSPSGSSVQTGIDLQVITPGYLSGLGVYIPQVGSDVWYRVAALNYTDPNDEFWEVGDYFQEDAVGWVEETWPKTLLYKGTKLRYILIYEDRTSDIFFDVQYFYTANKNSDRVPGSGEIHNWENADHIRVHKTDADGNAGAMDAVQPGAVIGHPSGSWTVVEVIDGGTYWEYGVVEDGRPQKDREHTFNVATPVGSFPQFYVENLGYWTAHVPTSAIVQGYKNLDGVETLDDTGYGINLKVQDANISDKWLPQAYSGD